MKRVCVKAPINIALIKYWGKKDEHEVLPFNPSISLSLDLYHTITTLEENPEKGLHFTINGQEDAKTKAKVHQFLKLFTDDNTLNLTVITHNTGPTAAGLASSASAFAALALAAQHYFGTPKDFQSLARLTKKGSGSAIRSLLGGCVEWQTNGEIRPLDWPFDDVVLGVIVLFDGVKSIGSTEAMKQTVQTAPSYAAWVQRAHEDAVKFKHALDQNDFSSLGLIAEENALAMHTVCADAKPPIHYLTQASKTLIEAVKVAREHGLFEAYCTMDAGPNVKLIHRENESQKIKRWLKAHGWPEMLVSRVAQKGAVLCEQNTHS